jgi:hypothetical protein
MLKVFHLYSYMYSYLTYFPFFLYSDVHSNMRTTEKYNKNKNKISNRYNSHHNDTYNYNEDDDGEEPELDIIPNNRNSGYPDNRKHGYSDPDFQKYGYPDISGNPDTDIRSSRGSGYDRRRRNSIDSVSTVRSSVGSERRVSRSASNGRMNIAPMQERRPYTSTGIYICIYIYMYIYRYIYILICRHA